MELGHPPLPVEAGGIKSGAALSGWTFKHGLRMFHGGASLPKKQRQPKRDLETFGDPKSFHVLIRIVVYIP